MKPRLQCWRVAASFVLLCFCARMVAAQTQDSVYVSFTSIGIAGPLTTVGGVLHADDCDSVRILSLIFTWHDHFPPYQVQPLDWSASNGTNVPKNFPLPPTAPGFPEDVHLVYVVYPDGTTQNLDVESLVPGQSYQLAPGCPPVPVQLASFTGVIISNGVRLDWMTVSEVNNYGFIVQKRRLAELDWSAIPNSFVAGHGTTSIPRHYTFTDAAAVLSPVQYRLNQIDLDRTQHYTEPITLGIPTAVVQQPAYKFLLEQNYPNPFNPTTIIKYQIPSTNHATLSVFDVLGREVATLVNEVKQPGTYTVQWDARLRSANFGGQASMQASGVYFYRLQSGGFVSTKKLMLLR